MSADFSDRPLGTLGAAVSIERLADDPYPLLHDLRQREPVTWAAQLGRWLVTSRRLIVDGVLRDGAAFTTDSPASPIRATFGPQMLSADGDDHRRHRDPFAPAFRARALRERCEASVRVRAAATFGAVPEGGDLVDAAATMAIETAVDALGIVVEDVDQVRHWYDDLAAALANTTNEPSVAGRGLAAADAFRSFIRGRLDDRQGLEEQLSDVILTLFGGIETTQSMILNAIWAIASTDSAPLTLEARDATRLADAVEETLRWEPAVQTLTRFARADVELGDVTIRAGDVVECMIGGANRDPAWFDTPDEFVPDRPNARDHLTFGYGRHLCLGLHLARMETIAVLEVLGARGPFSLGPGSTKPTGHEFRRPRRLELSWP